MPPYLTSLVSFFSDFRTHVLQRFPLAVFFTLLLTLLTADVLYTHYVPHRLLPIAVLQISVGLWGALSLRLVAETHHWTLGRQVLVAAISFANLFLLTRSIPSNNADLISDPLSLFPLFIAAFLSVFIAPYLFVRSSVKEVWYFNYRLWMHLLFTYLFLTFFIAAIFVLFYAVKYLLFPLPEKYVEHTALFILASFAPLFAMKGIPSDFKQTAASYPRWCFLLTARLLIPVLFLYALILHVYAIKIAYYQLFPLKKVAYYVVSFGMVGFITLLITAPLKEQADKMIAWFHRSFVYLLIVPVLLFVVALVVTVENYGMTVSRYLITLVAVWIVGMMGVTLFHRKAVPIRYAYVSLIVLVLLTSINAIGPKAVALNSQMARLETLLEKNHMLLEGKIVPLASGTVLPENNRKEIQASVRYVLQKGGYERMRQLFAATENAPLSQKRHFTESDVMQSFGMVTPSASPLPHKNGAWISIINHYFDQISSTMDVAGFTDIAHFVFDARMPLPSKEKYLAKYFRYTAPQERYWVTFYQDTSVIEVAFEGASLSLPVPLSPLFEKLAATPFQKALRTDFVAEAENAQMKVRVLIRKLSMQDKRAVVMEADVMLRKKE